MTIFIRWHSQDSMLHNIWMFCSIKFIFISKNLSLHWHHVQKCLQNIWRNCWEPHQITEILIINFDERYMFYIELKINLFLMQPLSPISKKLYGKSTIFNNLRTTFSHKCKPHSYPLSWSTKVIFGIINLHLPLLIFVGMHSQNSHNKCLFC